ncbi:MAG: SGNH/GDSL hydrolase family protein [Bacteroidetes bacterium]|nr:SGNH/GDSL hydrolase family protein [Bacteroidota bacterium]
MQRIIYSIFFMTIFSLSNAQPRPLRYVALGDSYTICTGTGTAQEHWPDILVKHLAAAGIAINLEAIPARNGYSTQNLIDEELPVFDETKPDFVTLLIGVNDWVRGVDSTDFHKNLVFILDHVQSGLPVKNHLVLFTIPDFGVTPQGALYSRGRNISEGISAFNAIIQQEAVRRGLLCIDVFPLSKAMGTDASLVAADGLHPSAREYAFWEEKAFPEIKKLLQKK